MTKETLERSRKRRRQLKEELIPAVIGAIQEVGRVSNDEPERLELQDKLRDLEAELARLEVELSRAKVPCGSVEVASIGSVVTFVHLGTGIEQTLTLISSNGNPTTDKTISVNSPVGKNLLGKKEGEEFEVVYERDEIGKGKVKRTETYKLIKVCAGEGGEG